MRSSDTPSKFLSRFEHHEAGHVFALVEKMRLGWLLQHFPSSLVWALYVFVNGFVTIALLATLGVLTDTPFVFPSLGPTAYLFFFVPLGNSSSPRNAILGHAIGLFCGYGAFWVTGSPSAQAPFHLVYWPRVIAAALSLASTGALMVLLRVSHPPAGATTLIVSLGIISKPSYLMVIEVAVCLLTVQAFVINRLAGLPYPIWESSQTT